MLSDTSLTKVIDHSHLHHVTKHDSDGIMADIWIISEEMQIIMYNEWVVYSLYSQIYFHYSTSMDSSAS